MKLNLRVVKMPGKCLIMYLEVQLILRRKGAMGYSISWISSSSVIQAGTLSCFLDQWKRITSNTFMLNVVKGHHLWVRCCPPLFHKFK